MRFAIRRRVTNGARARPRHDALNWTALRTFVVFAERA
jgi:hypothetical protein